MPKSAWSASATPAAIPTPTTRALATGSSGGDALAVSVNAENVMTGAGTAILGTWNRIKASAAITITIPGAVASANNSFCGIIIDKSSGNNLVTIQDAAGAPIDYDCINGTQTAATTRIMWAGESAMLKTNQVYWHKVAGKTIPMASCLGLSGNQVVSTSTVTLLTCFGTSLYNNAPSAMQSTAKLTALRRGQYVLYVMASLNSTNTNGCLAGIYTYKNGVIGLPATTDTNTSSFAGNSIAGVFPLLLSAGDYLQPYGYFNAGTFPTSFLYNDYGSSNPDNYFALMEVPTW